MTDFDSSRGDTSASDDASSRENTADRGPVSRRPVELTVLGQVRSYSDEQLLERAWKRLETRGQRSTAVKPAVRFLAAAALLAAGFAAGRFTEESETAADAAVSREFVAVAEVPAGPQLDAGAPRRALRRAAADSRSSTDKESSAPRMSRSLASRVAVESELTAEAFVGEDEYELEAEEPRTQARPLWLAQADRGDFAGAFQVLDESGGFDSVLQSGSAEELMTLVDVARFVGNQGRAIQALRVVTERHQGDANAPLAAMMLGNLLSRAGDQTGAAAAFALNRSLSPGGDFAEDALVREFDMAVAAVDLPTVLRLSSQYEQEFPQGRHQKELRAEVARLRRAAPVAEPVDRENRVANSAADASRESGSENAGASDDDAGSANVGRTESDAADSEGADARNERSQPGAEAPLAPRLPL